MPLLFVLFAVNVWQPLLSVF